MSTEDQDTDQRIFCHLLFSHFKRHKLGICQKDAQRKTFPLLETLHDRGFISDNLYEDCQESCRNLVPVQRVVYTVLHELEKKADGRFLEALFSENNMKEYPDLRYVFENGISSDDSRDGEELPEPSTSAQKRGPVKERGNRRIQMLGIRNPSKRGKPRGRRAVNTRTLKRKRRKVPTISQECKMMLQCPQIPVYCGEARGILHREKMKKGSTAKCVQSEDKSRWFTLREFEVEGGRAASKKWRVSVRFEEWTLGQLIKENCLPNPPRRRRKQAENRNICEVCRGPGLLFCCDTCPRSFHQKCHIQQTDSSGEPWSCILCQIRKIQRSSPETQQRHKESEVLKRPMTGVDKLKCQFLLLKIFSSSPSSSLISNPDCREQLSQGKRKFMWLNRIRQKFYNNLYSRVETFVLDMRLVFQNHREHHRENNFLNLGLRLEKQFEEDFQSIFAIRK